MKMVVPVVHLRGAACGALAIVESAGFSLIDILRQNLESSNILLSVRDLLLSMRAKASICVWSNVR